MANFTVGLINSMDNITTLNEIPVFLNEMTGGFFGVFLTMAFFLIPLLKSQDKLNGLIIGSYLATILGILLWFGNLITIDFVWIYATVAIVATITAAVRK